MSYTAVPLPVRWLPAYALWNGPEMYARILQTVSKILWLHSVKRVQWSWRFYTILIPSLPMWSNIQRNTCISQKKRPLGLVLVSVFTKSISISVPLLDSRLFTVNYLVLDLKMNSDWKSFTVVVRAVWVLIFFKILFLV